MLKGKEKTKKEIRIFELLWLFLSILAISSIALLCFDSFKSIYALGISLALTILFLSIFKFKILIKDKRFNWIILLILLLAFVIRISPWIYLEGGQDQGVYVAMSSQYEETRGFRFKDHVQSYLSEEAFEKYQKDRAWEVGGLGREKANDDFIFLFYPAHPALMSITSTLLGKTNITYELTLFSILSIAAVYLLSTAIFKKKTVGYISAGLLALSPLHLYFSRFPVTEVIALAISISVLYFLLKGHRTKEWIYFFLSFLLINFFFYLRMTWIISAPFYVLTIISVLTFVKDLKLKNLWIWFGISLLVAYLISSLFYYVYIPGLYKHFYYDIFDYIPENIYFFFISSIPLIVYLLVCPLKKYTKTVLTFLYNRRNILIVIFFVVLAYFTIYHLHRVAFTEKFLGTSFDYFWGMANRGWFVVKDMPATSIILHLSPFGVLAYLISIKRLNTPQKVLLTFFMFLFLGFNIIKTRFTPYQFYYARYQLSEIIPIIYIFVSALAVHWWNTKRVFFYILILPIFIYNIFFSAFQFQGYVGTSPKFFQTIQQEVGKESVVIYYNPTDWSSDFTYSPLKYFFNQPSIKTFNIEDTYIYAQNIKERGGQVHVLSTVEMEEDNLEFVSKNTYHKNFYSNAFEDKEPLRWKVSDPQLPFCKDFIDEKYCGGMIPLKYHQGEIDMYLYLYK